MNADSGVAHFNHLPRDAALAAMLQCCGSRAWAEAMTDTRPYDSRAQLFSTADAVWSALPGEDKLEAFRAHPRIGERNSDKHSAWSQQEQAGAANASADVLAQLAHLNRVYEQRFGHIFLICATGLSAADVLSALRARLRHDEATELRIAAEEQRKITHIRLEKLL